MKLIVTKFGGTSVGTIDRIKSVATRIKNEVNNGYNVIVVVSAMAGETNRLIKLVERTMRLGTYTWTPPSCKPPDVH